MHLVLPGTVQAYMQSSVYAQISGYIKSWNVDIGAPVKAGQLLATIEAPVIEQNLFQAQANLGQAQANLGLAKTTAARYNNLLATHAVSQQDVDNQNANVQVMAGQREGGRGRRRRASSTSSPSGRWSRPSTAWSRRGASTSAIS